MRSNHSVIIRIRFALDSRNSKKKLYSLQIVLHIDEFPFSKSADTDTVTATDTKTDKYPGCCSLVCVKIVFHSTWLPALVLPTCLHCPISVTRRQTLICCFCCCRCCSCCLALQDTNVSQHLHTAQAESASAADVQLSDGLSDWVCECMCASVCVCLCVYVCGCLCIIIYHSRIFIFVYLWNATAKVEAAATKAGSNRSVQLQLLRVSSAMFWLQKQHTHIHTQLPS